MAYRNTASAGPDKSQSVITIGGVDLSQWLVSLKTSSTLRHRGTAVINLRSEVEQASVWDYTGIVTVSVRFADPGSDARRDPPRSTDTEGEQRLFTGSVQSVVRTATGIEIRCEAGTDLLSDTVANSLQTNAGTAEKIWSLCRVAGVDEDSLDIDGIELVPADTFAVFWPIEELDIAETIRVGRVEFIPIANPVTPSLLEGFRPSPEVERFGNAACIAFCSVESTRLFDAEQEGTEEIDLALAWLAARRHDSRGVILGELADFDRLAQRAIPRRADAVLVHGLRTGRRWLRVPSRLYKPAHFPISASSMMLKPPLSEHVDDADRHAILAWWRARRTDDAMAAIASLWEAIEFYVSGVTVPDLFSREDAKRNRQLVREHVASFTPEQRTRIYEMLAMLNTPPLLVRLRQALLVDRVPHSEDELRILWEMRRLRNDALHGRERNSVSSADLRRALALVARMLVHRLEAYTDEADVDRR